MQNEEHNFSSFDSALESDKMKSVAAREWSVKLLDLFKQAEQIEEVRPFAIQEENKAWGNTFGW